MYQDQSFYKAVCFGEILWDLLPGVALPGGAPMNVAYHLKRLGVEPALITRIGQDEWGEKLLRLMMDNHVATAFFQTDPEWPTGKVNALIAPNNEVSYEIVKPVAWDNIQWDTTILPALSSSNYFIYGSLATRSETSRNTLFSLLELSKFNVLDINLRPPFYNRSIIECLLSKTHLLKLNLAELELITDWFTNYRSDVDRINFLQDRFQITQIIVTQGSEGAVLVDQGAVYRHSGFKVKVADTIGSGDAFLAGFLARLLSGASPYEALEFANALGALIATRAGACPDYSIEDVVNLASPSYMNSKPPGTFLYQTPIDQTNHLPHTKISD